MGVVQNTIDIEKSLSEVMALAAKIGDDTSGIVKDIDDLQEANAQIMTSVSTNARNISSLETATEVKDITTEFFSLLSENNLSLYTAVSKVYKVGRLIVINAVLEQPNGYATGTEEHFAFPSKYSPAIDLVYNAHIAESGYAGNSAGIGCYLYLNNSGGGIIKNISSASNNWKYVKINLAYIHK